MTWDEAQRRILPPEEDEEVLAPMLAEARAALALGEPFFERALQLDASEEGCQRAVVMACLGAGVACVSQALAQGPAGAGALLLADGFVTRALELAAPLGRAYAAEVARMATTALAAPSPREALEAALTRRARTRRIQVGSCRHGGPS